MESLGAQFPGNQSARGKQDSVTAGNAFENRITECNQFKSNNSRNIVFQITYNPVK